MSLKDAPHRVLAIDINASVSPFARVFTTQEFNPDEQVAALQAELNAVLQAFAAALGGEFECLFDKGLEVKVHPGTDTNLLNSKERGDKWWQEFKALQATLAPDFEAAAQVAQNAIANHPDNGKLGYWRVEGMRHSAIVKADSAQAAIDKAGEIVQAWEMPTADFIGLDIDVCAC